MISRVELKGGGYSVVIENDPEEKTRLGVENWQLIFLSKQEVVDHIRLLEKALEFWEYD